MDPTEKLTDHEVRIRLMEATHKGVVSLLRWIMVIGITSIAIPLLVHYMES